MKKKLNKVQQKFWDYLKDIPKASSAFPRVLDGKHRLKMFNTIFSLPKHS